MAGFLQGLGEFSSGVAKGISQESEDSERRQRARSAKNAEDQAELDRQAAEQEKVDAAAAAGTTYTPRTVEKPSFSGDLHKVAGALAGLFNRRSVDQTAAAAGVTDPPPVVGLPSTPGSSPPLAPAAALPSPAPPSDTPYTSDLGAVSGVPGVGPTPLAAAATAAAGPATADPLHAALAARAPLPMSAAATPTPSPVPPALAAAVDPVPPDVAAATSNGPPGYVPPTSVPNADGTDTRPPTAVDLQLREAHALLQHGHVKEGTAAFQKYVDMSNRAYVAAVPYLSTRELGDLYTKTSGQQGSITKDDDGRYTVTTTEKDGSGNLKPVTVMKDLTTGEFQEALLSRIGADPALGAGLAKESRDEFAKMAASRSVMAERAANAENLRATAAHTGQATKSAQTQEDRGTKFYNDTMDLAPRYSTVREAQRYDAYANSGAILEGKGFMSPETATGADGEAVKQAINIAQKHASLERAEWAKLDVGRTNIVQPILNPATGKTEWTVIEPDGTAKIKFGTDVDSAIDYAHQQINDGKYGGLHDVDQIAAMLRKKAGKPNAAEATAAAKAAATAAKAKTPLADAAAAVSPPPPPRDNVEARAQATARLNDNVGPSVRQSTVSLSDAQQYVKNNAQQYAADQAYLAKVASQPRGSAENLAQAVLINAARQRITTFKNRQDIITAGGAPARMRVR